MTELTLRRRAFLQASAASAVALAPVAARANTASSTFTYEVQRTEEEWRARLSKEEYNILRNGGTELPKTSETWDEERDGAYSCKGCELVLYESVWKEQLDIGWAFFAQSVPDTILMGIDGSPPYGNRMGDNNAPPAMIEAHCRRCGSHLGHILTVKGKTLHCINGTALDFQPAEA